MLGDCEMVDGKAGGALIAATGYNYFENDGYGKNSIFFIKNIYTITWFWRALCFFIGPTPMISSPTWS